MNTSEREQLAQFLQQLTQAQAGAKDAEAQSLISLAMVQQPDAAYLLVQRALLQDGAIKVANEHINALQEELNQLKQPARSSGGGFLDAIGWGRAPAAPSAPFAPAAPPPYAAPQASQQAVPPASAGYYPPSAPAAPAAAPGFQAPSFLTSMATTAAGVAAGAFLFQGIGHLMGGGHQNGGASAFGLSGPQAFDGQNGTPQTEVINNYYDTPQSANTSDGFLDASSSGDGFDGVDLDPNNDWS